MPSISSHHLLLVIILCSQIFIYSSTIICDTKIYVRRCWILNILSGMNNLEFMHIFAVGVRKNEQPTKLKSVGRRVRVVGRLLFIQHGVHRFFFHIFRMSFFLSCYYQIFQNYLSNRLMTTKEFLFSLGLHLPSLFVLLLS